MSAQLADRSPRGGVVVRGPAAASFLQSLVSQDIEGIGDGEGAHSLLLTPQGKLDVDFRVLRVGDEWWLDCEPEFGGRLSESLTRFKLRVDADISDMTDGWGLLVVRGHEAPARVAAVAGVDVPDAAHAHVGWGGARIVRGDWPGLPGVDIVGPGDDVKHARDELLRAGVEPFPPGAFEAARIGAGVALQGVDIDEKTIPQEGVLEHDAISFTKGCFLGQELVARIDSRGHVNRYLRLVRVPGAPGVARGAVVVAGDKDVGALTSVAEVPGEERTVALAMVRREIEPPATVALRWDGHETAATVEPLPE